MSQASDTKLYTTARKRYRLLEPISESHTATMWRGRDTVAQRDVAVKRLRALDDPVARRRLVEEAEANERVSHPGSVPLLDSWFAEDEAALVFAYVPGITLAQRLHERGALEAREAAKIGVELADVLAATHAAGLIHRDVKPANILLGEDGHARLVDFGISVVGERDPRELDLTGSGRAIGTLPYMAPEQLTDAPATPALDIYALGVVTYEMLTGERPFDGASPVEQLQLQQLPPRPMSAVPPALATLTFDALDAVPAKRPSAAQLGRALSAWLEGRGESEAPTQHVAAAPPLASPVAPPASRRGRAHNAAAFVAVALAVAALAALVFGASRISVSNDAPGTQPAAAVVALPSPTTAPPSTSTPTPPRAPIAAVTGASDNRPAATASPAKPAPAHHGHHHGHRHHRHRHHKHHHPGD